MEIFQQHNESVFAFCTIFTVSSESTVNLGIARAEDRYSPGRAEVAPDLLEEHREDR